MVSIKRIGRQAATAVRAFDPITKGGREARAEVRQVAASSGKVGKAALLIAGPPSAKTTVGAIAETTLRLAPLPALGAAGRVSRGIVKPTAAVVGKAAKSATPVVAKVGATAAKGTARAARQTAAAVKSTGTKVLAATPGVARAAGRGAVRYGGALGRAAARRPLAALAIGGAAAYGLGHAVNSVRRKASPGDGGIPAELAGTPAGGYAPAAPEALGSDPVSPDYSGGVLGNLTAGVGSAIERIGDGVGDALGAIGVEVAPGVGKLVAIGGGVALAVWGLPKLLAAGKTSGAFSGAKSGGSGVKGAAKAVRGPGGRFLKAVA